MKEAFSKIRVHLIALLAYILCMLVKASYTANTSKYEFEIDSSKCTKQIVVTVTPHVNPDDTGNNTI